MEIRGLSNWLSTLVVYGMVLSAHGCNINNCIQSALPFTPQSCQEYTNQLQCIKKEFDSCASDTDRHTLMMSSFVALGVNRGPMCGFDMQKIQEMMTARTGLMMSMYNGTSGLYPGMWYGGDEGPFGDDGPMDMDDGPMDDGPFDDGPFDDGPFEDGWGFMGMPGMTGNKGGQQAATGGGTSASTAQSNQRLSSGGVRSNFGVARQVDDRDVNTYSSGTSVYASACVTMVTAVLGSLAWRI